MYCVQCGKELQVGAASCGGCGRTIDTRSESRELSPYYGVASFVLAALAWGFFLSSLVALGIAFGVAAAAVGAFGLQNRGRGLAIAGIVIGGLCVLSLPVLWAVRLTFSALF